MQLRVFVLSKSYTLRPTREYVLGCGEDCDIQLGVVDATSLAYLKLSYNHEENIWYAYEINPNSCMTVNGQRMTRCPIRAEVRISLANQFFLTAAPQGDPLVPSLSNLNPGNQISQYSYGKEDSGIPVINLGWKWFKIASPSDGVGIRLSAFDLYQTYAVRHARLHDLCEMLYRRVYQSISDGALREAKIRLVNYRKSSLTHADTRKYLLVTRDTIHGNRTTVFVRFLEFGDNLFLGLDVYSLGRINWITFLARVIATFLLLPSIVFGIPAFLLLLLWWKIIWRMNYENKLWLPLRQEHPGKIGIGPFDSDDVIMFSKSTVHLAITTVRDVFKENNLPVDSLDEFILNINSISIDNSVRIDNRGGSIMHSSVGLGNKMSK